MSIRHVSVRLGAGRNLRRAIDDVTLDLDLGVHGLLGPNGAGKTTLMRVLATVAEPSAGRLLVMGRDVSIPGERRDVRRHLGYLPQSFGYYRRFTVREFVTYFAWLKEVPSAAAPSAVDRALTRVGLADRADSRLKTLSGGMLRRAGLAQALVNEPRVLLLDEPTAGLDPEQRLQFRELLKEVAVDTTVLVSTHLVEDVAAVCTSVAVLDAGRLVLTGTPAQLEALGRSGGEEVERSKGASATELGYTEALRGHRSQSVDSLVERS